MQRIALGLSYCGLGRQGWQTQPGGRTLQDALEAALLRFLTVRTGTICAGRTDAGVHALQQVVHVDSPQVRREHAWVRGLNSFLPHEMAVQWARVVPDAFHARFSATARTYVYVLASSPVRSPLLRGRVGWVREPLDLARMRQAATWLAGTHDFSTFRSADCQAATPVRTLQPLHIAQHGAFLLFRFQANAFLHHMVRNLMGALIAVGRGRRPPEWVQAILLQKDRRVGAPTFMPDGLYLAHVAYPDRFQLPLLPSGAALAQHLGFCEEADGT